MAFSYRSGLALLLRTDISGSLLNVLGVQRDLPTKLVRELNILQPCLKFKNYLSYIVCSFLLVVGFYQYAHVVW